MKTNIITKNISSLEFIELRDFMQNCIEDSMKSLDSHDCEKIMWYEDCGMEDYFTMWQEIYDELGTKIGEGLDTIAHEFILNDDTRADFENAFEQARENAFESVMEDLGEEIEDFYENDFEGFDELEYQENDEDGNEWDGEVEGYERIGWNNTNSTEFLDSSLEKLYFCIYNNMRNGLSADAFAAWAGATAMAYAESTEYCDWSAIYYKEKEG